MNQLNLEQNNTWSRQRQYLKREHGPTRFKLGTYIPVRNGTRWTREVHLPASHVRSAKIAHRVKHEIRQPECTLQELSTTTKLILLNDSGALVDDPELPDPLLFQIGGLRTDPFRMFPIESKDHIAEAFDYCKTRLQ